MAEPLISPKMYGLTYAALIGLALLTTVIAFFDLGQLNLPLAIGIALAKMLLVGLFFMHLRYSAPLPKVTTIAALIWFLILMSWVLADYFTRGWLPYPGD